MAIRTNIYLSQIQVARLKKLSDETDLSVAEHVRRAVDDYLTKVERKAKREASNPEGRET